MTGFESKRTDKMSVAWAQRHQDCWRLHLKKLLGNMLAKDVTRAHLASALDVMTRKGIRRNTQGIDDAEFNDGLWFDTSFD